MALFDGIADSIFALSSGAPPAGIAVVRISGPHAGDALRALAGTLPSPRRATLRELRDPAGALLDRALLLWLPGPATVTGEALAELHLHGGRAVVDRVLAVLDARPGLRRAVPGEFTRRAFLNGRIDLLEAEGLADLLAAETEQQRRSALAVAEGGLSRDVEDWRGAVLRLAATVEALLDFGDEDDVAAQAIDVAAGARALADAIAATLARPSAERLRDGIRVVLAGPPNAGKSSLLNALTGRDAAIVSAIAGTTRDVVEVPVALGGVPFLLSDTAGLRDGGDAIERIGIDRAEQRIATADLLLWLGDDPPPPHPARLWLYPRVDAAARLAEASALTGSGRLAVSAVTGEGLDALIGWLLARSEALLPRGDGLALSRRQRSETAAAAAALTDAAEQHDLVLQAEHLRRARESLDRLTGRAGFEDLMDMIFGQFCLGK